MDAIRPLLLSPHSDQMAQDIATAVRVSAFDPLGHGILQANYKATLQLLRLLCLLWVPQEARACAVAYRVKIV